VANKEHLRILSSGIKAWNHWRWGRLHLEPDSEWADHTELSVDKPDLSGADLNESNFSGADFSGTDFSGANLRDADLTNVRLNGAKLTGVDLRDTDLFRADLNGADLRAVDLRWASLKKADLSESDLSGASILGADLNLAILRRVDLRGADLSRANLQDADLSGADLRGVKFDAANLTSANLLGAKVDAKTRFDKVVEDPKDDSETTAKKIVKSVSTENCRIDAYALASLDDLGGLDAAQIAVMDVTNDLADLRASYSGLKLWIHLTTLVAFLLPYAWFLASNYAIAHFGGVEGRKTITLLEALLRYIWNGGAKWQEGWFFSWSFLAFSFLAIYNFGRGILLWQTNNLEHREEITGVRVRFSLATEPFWRRLIKTMALLFWMSLAALAYNSHHFLSQEIPIAPTVSGGGR